MPEFPKDTPTDSSDLVFADSYAALNSYVWLHGDDHELIRGIVVTEDSGFYIRTIEAVYNRDATYTRHIKRLYSPEFEHCYTTIYKILCELKRI